MSLAARSAILLVEDSDDDVFLMKRALKAAGVVNPLSVAGNGQEAIDYLDGAGKYADRETYPMPTFVFLDVKLPRKTGHEVLAWTRRQQKLEGLVVLVLTSSNEPSDLREAYRLGANSYIVKPPSTDRLVELAKAFRQYWLEFNRALPA
jgi:CheY-like chemotaxis protein